MKSSSQRKYTSPLRESQARETRERILSAVAGWMHNEIEGEFTFDDIARGAGVEKRTVFRHFETKEALLEAFWVWINQRLVPSTLPRTVKELIDGPRLAFPKFDEVEGVIRGSLHTRTGRAMRMGAVSARRGAFHNAIQEAASEALPNERQRVEIIAHALYSAAAWEAMRDYAGVDGETAGDAATWALSILIDSIRQRKLADRPSPKETNMPTINIQHAANAETLWVVRDRVRFMGDLAGTDLSVIEIEVPPGSGTPPHTHRSPEIFRVLSGQITFGLFQDGPPQELRAEAGTVVTVPSNVGHNYANMTDEPAAMLVVVEQSMISFFRDIGQEATPPAGPPSDVEIAGVMEACARHGIALLGGPA